MNFLKIYQLKDLWVTAIRKSVKFWRSKTQDCLYSVTLLKSCSDVFFLINAWLENENSHKDLHDIGKWNPSYWLCYWLLVVSSSKRELRQWCVFKPLYLKCTIGSKCQNVKAEEVKHRDKSTQFFSPYASTCLQSHESKWSRWLNWSLSNTNPPQLLLACHHPFSCQLRCLFSEKWSQAFQTSNLWPLPSLTT